MAKELTWEGLLPPRRTILFYTQLLANGQLFNNERVCRLVERTLAKGRLTWNELIGVTAWAATLANAYGVTVDWDHCPLSAVPFALIRGLMGTSAGQCSGLEYIVSAWASMFYAAMATPATGDVGTVAVLAMLRDLQLATLCGLKTLDVYLWRVNAYAAVTASMMAEPTTAMASMPTATPLNAPLSAAANV